jgi:ATP adenylyltransferase
LNLKDFGQLLQQVWPQERDFMERPDRYKYVRKIIQPKTCVFCEAASTLPSQESLLLCKTKSSMVVMNKYPYNNGHLLVLPQKHIGRIQDLSSEEYDDLSSLLRKTVEILEAVYELKGFNIGMNHGEVAGAGIPSHLHWHVVPRWMGDTNFFPVVAETKVLAETLDQTYQKLKPHFAGLK